MVVRLCTVVPKGLAYLDSVNSNLSHQTSGALYHGKLRDELKDLEECLAQAVSEAADMAKYKEMIEGQLSAAKEISNRDEATLLRIQESLLSNTEGAEKHPCEPERLGSDRSSTSVEKLSSQVADQLEAIRKSLQAQVEEHTSYATHLEHCLASRGEVTEDKSDTLQEVLQATQRKSVQASLEIQTLNQVIGTLKEHDDESAALVANLKQEVAEANDILSKQVEETAERMVVEAAEVQNLNEVIRILREQNAENAMLAQSAAESCAHLKQELVESKDALHKQVEESAQDMAAKTVEVENLSEMINTLKEQNAEIAESAQNAAECRDTLKQQLAECKDALHKQVKELTQQIAAKTSVIENMSELMNTIKEQNAEDKKKDAVKKAITSS